MLINELLKLSLNYYDNINNTIKNFFNKYNVNDYIYKIENDNNQYYINIYKNKDKVAYCKINKIFDFIINIIFILGMD